MTIADGMHQIVDNINGARSVRVSDIAGLARELPPECWEEYGSKYILFVTMRKGLHPFECNPLIRLCLLN